MLVGHGFATLGWWRVRQPMHFRVASTAMWPGCAMHNVWIQLINHRSMAVQDSRLACGVERGRIDHSPHLIQVVV